MNKVIKFVLLMLFAVISFSAANIIKNDLADSKIKQIYNVQGYKQIFLPSSIDKNEELVSIMKGVSEKNDTPFLFRSEYIGVENNNNGNPNLLKEKNDVMFFSSKNLPQNSKTILSHGFTYNFFYEFLSEMSSVQLTNSDIYISDKHLNSTLQELSKVFNQKYKLKINSQKLMVRPSDYPPTSYTDFISYNNYNLVFFITVSIIFFSIFLFVWLMANNKAISIYRLNGLSAYKIGKQLFLKEFATVSLATYLVASLVAFRAFNFDYTLQMLSLSGLVVILSYISIAIVSSFSLTNQLNSKPFFKYSYFILYAVKAFVFLVTVSTTASLLYFVNADIGTKSKIGEEYAVLYPEFVGYGLNSNQMPSSVKLFDYAEKHEGLYVYLASAYDENNINVLQVNDNYLSKFSIISSDNQRIKINSQEKSGIVLIAEKDKSKLSEIKKEYDFADSFNSSKIKYYFIKNNQKAPLLDGSNRTTHADVIKVFTSKNVAKDTNFLYNSVLKFKIEDSKTKTYEKIAPTLKTMEALATHPSMITVNSINKTTSMSIVGSIPSYVVLNVLVIIIFLSMILATTLFYFETYKKKIAVKRLYGISFFVTYKTLFAIVLVQGSLYFAFALSQRDVNITLEGLGIYFVLEILIIILILLKLQKGLFLNVLKGE
ncbi:DUF1430 domain-containing protein [Lactococcus lactis]|uniref:Bacteriocin-associated integral membrane protein n=1 Tax=Lactococcus lactis subsp. lactis TaxID=1360 RepID=A0A2N5WD05_LACLL|nr:DUF1430 domain-containing protein [Lactococcus lactis]PLW60101.1 bacteriocin-associated integral membrane protein [Lactococcus lactis subsp. lactis]